MPVESLGGFGPERLGIGEGGGVGGLLGVWRHIGGMFEWSEGLLEEKTESSTVWRIGWTWNWNCGMDWGG